MLRQVKSYIDNNTNPAKVNVIDPTKENITRPLSTKEILDEFFNESEMGFLRIIMTELYPYEKIKI